MYEQMNERNEWLEKAMSLMKFRLAPRILATASVLHTISASCGLLYNKFIGNLEIWKMFSIIFRDLKELNQR